MQLYMFKMQEFLSICNHIGRICTYAIDQIHLQNRVTKSKFKFEIIIVQYPQITGYYYPKFPFLIWFNRLWLANSSIYPCSNLRLSLCNMPKLQDIIIQSFPFFLKIRKIAWHCKHCLDYYTKKLYNLWWRFSFKKI